MAHAVALVGGAAAQDDEGDAERRGEERAAEPVRRFAFTLPVLLDGLVLGQTTADIGTDDTAFVDLTRIAELLDGLALSEVLAALQEAAAAAGGERVLAASFDGAGLVVGYDPGQVALVLDLAPSARPEGRLGGGLKAASRTGTLDASGFSAGVNLFGRVANSAGVAGSGFAPLRGQAEGFIALGGEDGVALVGELFVDEGADSVIRRGRSSLVKDFPNEAIRLRLGDVMPFGIGFQSPRPLGGISIARRYEDIQPLRNIRAGGRTRFVLERPSVVEVVVNGDIRRTLQLAPGRYDIDDLTLSDGLNDVVLRVTDETGERELLSRSVFSSFQNLAEGILVFEAALGFPSRSSPKGFTYDDGDPSFSGFARYGLRAGTTLGAFADVSEGGGLVGGDVVLATPLGRLDAGLAASRRADDALGSAARVVFAASLPREGQLDLAARYTSRRFAADPASLGLQTEAWNVDARYSATLPGRLRARIGASRTFARGARPNRTTASLNLARPLGRALLTASFAATRSAGRTDHRGQVSIGVPLGATQRLRADVSTDLDRTALTWSRAPIRRLDDYSAQVGLLATDEETNLTADLRYAGNRFELRAQNAFLTGDDRDDVVGRVTALDVSAGIGVAGGRVALGRPFQQGFAVVERHPAIRTNDTTVRVGGQPVARAGALGPALVPINRGYTRQGYGLDVEDAPLGTDLLGGEFTIVPGFRSGYALQVGSEPALSVIGTLLNPDGSPYALIGGTMRPVGGGEGSAFFTNRAGRFVAEGLSAGPYELVFADRVLAQVEVEKGEDGFVLLGTVVADEEER